MLQEKYVGECPVCGSMQRLKSEKFLVNHGYTRPEGFYQNVGNCFGAGYPAYELSNEGCQAYVKYLNKLAKQLEEEASSAKSDKARSKLESDLTSLAQVIKDTNDHVNSWKPRSLQTVLELESDQRAQTSEAKIKKLGAKETKADAALERKWKAVASWRPCIEALMERGWILNTERRSICLTHPSSGHRLWFKAKQVQHTVRPTIARYVKLGYDIAEATKKVKSDQASFNWDLFDEWVDETNVVPGLNCKNVKAFVTAVETDLK